jgi:hypothetical protein
VEKVVTGFPYDTHRSVGSRLGVRTRSDQAATSGSFLAAVHGSPADREVVRSCGSQPHMTAGHCRALVVIAIGGPSPGTRTAPCVLLRPFPEPDCCRTPGRTGFCQGCLRVYMNQAATPEVVALTRSQTVLTGSGSATPSYGGFGGGHPHFRPHTDRRKPGFTDLTGLTDLNCQLRPAAGPACVGRAGKARARR